MRVLCEVELRAPEEVGELFCQGGQICEKLFPGRGGNESPGQISLQCGEGSEKLLANVGVLTQYLAQILGVRLQAVVEGLHTRPKSDPTHEK